jgi:hypothetical protein
MIGQEGCYSQARKEEKKKGRSAVSSGVGGGTFTKWI